MYTYMQYTHTHLGKKSKALSQKKAELERGQRFSGYMHKRSSNGSWKKKWCVLKGCVFGYYKYVSHTCDKYLLCNTPLRVQ